MDATLTDDESLVGEDCHIVAQADEGPRGPSTLNLEDLETYSHLVADRDKYSNLILLCRIHHKLVDDQPTTYPIERLLEMKQAHESWVRESLREFDESRQKASEIYAGYVDEWVRRADLEYWDPWTSFLLQPDPMIKEQRFNELKELTVWLLNRVWPEGFLEIEGALANFAVVLHDFLAVFNRHATAEFRNGELWTERFYRSDTWNPRYNEILHEYERHIDLIHDLVFELTRAANHVCDQVRAKIEPSFRMQEGVLIVTRPARFDIVTIRPEYKGDERGLHPYPGLDKFMSVRTNRDYHVDTHDNGP